MSDDQKKQRSEADAELEREIRNERKFTLAEAIGRMAGPGAMKGESPIARLKQAGVEIELWLTRNLSDAGGGLHIALLRGAKESELLLKNFEQPLVALGSYCQHILGSDFLLEELVRHADIEWGRVLGERPYFEQMGTPAHADDPYTIASVRKTLADLLKKLGVSESSASPQSEISSNGSTRI
jgi:hypothetical protein